MQTDVRLLVRGSHIVHEDFGGEVVVVNLKTGTYYGLNGTAVTIWQAVSDRLSAAQCAARVAGQYRGDAGAVTAGVTAFLERLESEELIMASGEPAGEAPVDPAAAASEAFVAPTFQRCTDMEELLVLDPVHEVDEMGWPSRPAPTE